MKGLVGILAVAALIFAGCVNKQKCLEQYGFHTCEQFKKAAATTHNNDEAIQYQTIASECGCK